MKFRQEVKLYIGSCLFLIAVLISGFIRFGNPDMTETRMFLAYWRQWIVVFALAVGGGYLIRSSEK